MWIAVCALIAASVVSATRASAKSSRPVVVHVQANLNALRNVHLSFRPADRLPPGGYYYAVIVLRPYKHYTRSNPPPCAISSDMERADYGYPRPGVRVSLTLAPTESAPDGHWCAGGSYAGAIYAFAHPASCKGTHSCPGEQTPHNEPGTLGCGGYNFCGVVPQKEHVYPLSLPRPPEGTSIVTYFQIVFPR
jgi:hypothetical protein